MLKNKAYFFNSSSTTFDHASKLRPSGSLPLIKNFGTANLTPAYRSVSYPPERDYNS